MVGSCALLFVLYMQLGDRYANIPKLSLRARIKTKAINGIQVSLIIVPTRGTDMDK